ncbi:MAG: c-type cytochrome [Xanthomonadales bacterium]|jgi:cytochrome c5|nr:c-type cytochrome [Xanthomonadales bacterium]
MDQQEDRAFLRQFSGVIVGFMLLTVSLIFLARHMQPEPNADANPSQAILAEQRIAPVAAVRSGEEGAAALAEVQAAGAETAPAGDVVVDGSAVYNGLCKACHEAGVAGAPIAGSDQMAVRLQEQGLETLVSHAINGINAMPPRGGNPALTDAQIQAAVEFMLP